VSWQSEGAGTEGAIRGRRSAVRFVRNVRYRCGTGTSSISLLPIWGDCDNVRLSRVTILCVGQGGTRRHRIWAEVTDKIIDLLKHRTSLAVVENIPSEPIDARSYVIELENEVFELTEALKEKDLELMRYRARQSKPVRRAVAARPLKRRS